MARRMFSSLVIAIVLMIAIIYFGSTTPSNYIVPLNKVTKQKNDDGVSSLISSLGIPSSCDVYVIGIDASGTNWC